MQRIRSARLMAVGRGRDRRRSTVSDAGKRDASGRIGGRDRRELIERSRPPPRVTAAFARARGWLAVVIRARYPEELCEY